MTYIEGQITGGIIIFCLLLLIYNFIVEEN